MKLKKNRLSQYLSENLLYVYIAIPVLINVVLVIIAIMVFLFLGADMEEVIEMDDLNNNYINENIEPSLPYGYFNDDYVHPNHGYTDSIEYSE